MTYTFY